MNKKLFLQLEKFAIVGFINTSIDFAVVNVLMFFTNTYKGQEIIIFNTISFTVAVINSYMLNKHWTFKDKNSMDKIKFVKFLAIALIGLILNTTIVYNMTTSISPMFGLGIKYWANFSKVVATFVVLGWNFSGYKFLVFK